VASSSSSRRPQIRNPDSVKNSETPRKPPGPRPARVVGEHAGDGEAPDAVEARDVSV